MSGVAFTDWQYILLTFLRAESILIEELSEWRSTYCLGANVRDNGWARAAALTQEARCRFVAIWAKEMPQAFRVYACFESQGKYLILRTDIRKENPSIASLTPIYSSANRLERHIHDLLGIHFEKHPDTRPWTRHQAWTKDVFPLRQAFVLEAQRTLIPSDNAYPFQKIQGHSVCEVPVGPVHAGIIEPGHFRFQIAGEDVLLLEERLGYVHRGIEKAAEGRAPESLIRLAGRISGDATVAYAWSACQACEMGAHLTIPPRAAFIRAILCERERIANHLGDIGAICNDVGFAFAYYQLGRLREIWQRLNAEVFQHRMMRDNVLVGGVKYDLSLDQLSMLSAQNGQFKKEFQDIYSILENSLSLQDRLKTTGILSKVDAKKLGALGYVGKASGCSHDVRRDAPCYPYSEFTVPAFSQEEGDVAARMNVRAQEVFHSLTLLNQLLAKLPEGRIRLTESVDFRQTEGLGLIESFRGEVLTYVSFDHHGWVDRFYARDPSWFNWPALETLILGNIVPDFPVCNKSVNGSYAGCDL